MRTQTHSEGRPVRTQGGTAVHTPGREANPADAFIWDFWPLLGVRMYVAAVYTACGPRWWQTHAATRVVLSPTAQTPAPTALSPFTPPGFFLF